MTDATLRRLMNSGNARSIARAWLGYKATCEMKLKIVEPLPKVTEADILQIAYSFNGEEQEVMQKAFDTYDALRYNNQLAMAQLQYASRRCEELTHRIDLAWMYELIDKAKDGIPLNQNYDNPGRYSISNYLMPITNEQKELRSDIKFYYNAMHEALKFVKAYNVMVEIATKYYKIQEIEDNWLMYDPADDIIDMYTQSKERFLRLCCDGLAYSEEKFNAIDNLFPEIDHNKIDVPEKTIKAATRHFANASAYEVLNILDGTVSI